MQGGVFALARFSPNLYDLRFSAIGHAMGVCVHCWGKDCGQHLGAQCKKNGGPGAPPRWKDQEKRIQQLADEKAELGRRIQAAERETAQLADEVRAECERLAGAASRALDRTSIL